MELHPRAFTPRTPPTPPPALALARDPLPLTAAVHAFIASKLGMRGVAESSAAAYQGHLGRFIRAVGASKTLDEASGEVEPFLLILKRRRRAPSYRAKAFSVYRDFYRWACEHGHAGANPLAEQRAPIVPDAEKRFLAVEEVHQLLDSVRAAPLTHAHRDYALYWTMYGTWGRGTEVCRSRAADYDLASCTVRFYGKGGSTGSSPSTRSSSPCWRSGSPSGRASRR